MTPASDVKEHTSLSVGPDPCGLLGSPQALHVCREAHPGTHPSQFTWPMQNSLCWVERLRSDVAVAGGGSQFLARGLPVPACLSSTDPARGASLPRYFRRTLCLSRARGRVCQQGRSHRCWSHRKRTSRSPWPQSARSRSLGHPALKGEAGQRSLGVTWRMHRARSDYPGGGAEEGVSDRGHACSRRLHVCHCSSSAGGSSCSHQAPQDPKQASGSFVSVDVHRPPNGDEACFQLSLVETLSYFQNHALAQSARTVFRVKTLRRPA